MLHIVSVTEADQSAQKWMGLYQREDLLYNNNQVFKKEGEDQFLFSNDKGHWMMGSQPEGSMGYFFQEKSGGSLPSSEGAWSFWDGEAWLDGHILRVEPLDIDGGFIVLFNWPCNLNIRIFREHSWFK